MRDGRYVFGMIPLAGMPWQICISRPIQHPADDDVCTIWSRPGCVVSLICLGYAGLGVGLGAGLSNSLVSASVLDWMDDYEIIGP